MAQLVSAQLSWLRDPHGRYYLLAKRVSDMLRVNLLGQPLALGSGKTKSAATHLAEVYRNEEGYVLINGHPKFANPLAVGACINEPPPDAHNNMRIVNAYAELVEAGDPELGIPSSTWCCAEHSGARRLARVHHPAKRPR
jgi:hypothetical protein